MNFEIRQKQQKQQLRVSPSSVPASCQKTIHKLEDTLKKRVFVLATHSNLKSSLLMR